MHTFLSYPRSGRHWVEMRMMLVAGIKGHDKPHDTDRLVFNSHGGYSAWDAGIVDRRPDILQGFSGGKLYLLLRDAVDMLPSFYAYLKNKQNHLGNFDTFLGGPYGMQRFAEFCSKIGSRLPGINHKVFHFKDLKNIESVDMAAEIMRTSVDDKEREFVFRNSDIHNIRSGRWDRDEIPVRTVQIIEAWAGIVGNETNLRAAPIPAGHPDKFTINEEQKGRIRRYMKTHISMGHYINEYCT